MQSCMFLLVSLFASGQAIATTRQSKAQTLSLTSENPMRKIIGMLQDMSKELEREGEIEKEIYDKALCACEGGTKHLDEVIAGSTASIEELTAKVAAETAEKTQAKQDVVEHKANAESATKDLSEATSLRDRDHKNFVAEEKDGKLNLKNLGQAIPAIEKGMGGAALMQMSGAPRMQRFIEITKYISSDDRSKVLAFLDQGDEEGETAQTTGAGEILGILKSMKDEMEKDLGELQTQETTDQNNFGDLKGAKKEEIKVAKESVITKEKRMGELALSLSENKHALEDSQEELADAQKFKSNMKEQCATMEKERDMRAKMRADEISAVSEAVGILNDDDALETFSKAKGGAALVQNQHKKTFDALLQLKQESARKLKQHKLSFLSLNGLSHRAPTGVAKAAGAAEELVKGMIGGMIGTLHDEDVGDEHKKDWCANETTSVHAMEVEKKTLLEQTNTDIAEMEDDIATLTSDIKGLNEKINALDKMVHETTEERKEEHQEFVDSFATSATAIRLIDKAVLRLERFYSPEKVAKKEAAVKAAALKNAGLSLLHKSTGPTSAQLKKMTSTLLPGGFDALIQQHSQVHSKRVNPVEIPETPGGTYEKSESGGVIGLMNDFKNDLKMDMTESETSEKFNSKEYVRVMSDAQEMRAADTKSMAHKKETLATTNEKLVSAKELAQLTDEEIHNTELYLVQLHAECDFLLRNFDVRHEGRIGEEVGLESAETIVTDEAPPSHNSIEEQYDDEHTQNQVDKAHPDTFGK